MTICQISTEKKENLFDFILNNKYKDHDEYMQNYKKQLGENLDVKIINLKIEYFNSFDYIIIDRDAFANEDRYVVQMMKSIISFMQKTIPIFIWINIPENYKKELIDIGVKNLIINENLDEQKEEITECFSEKGMQRYNKNWKTSGTENFEKYKFYEPTNQIYAIQFLSTNNEIKSISISLSLCMYINKVEGKVVYIAPRYSNEKINAIAKLLDAEKNDNYYVKDNIYITNDEDFDFEEKDTNFVIRDLGFIDDIYFDKNINYINDENYDKSIILCEPNPIEINTISNIFQNLNDNTYMVNSSNNYIKVDEIPNLKGEYKDLFEFIDKHMRIKRLEKQDDLIDIRTNRNFFHMLIEPHIIATSKE